MGMARTPKNFLTGMEPFEQTQFVSIIEEQKQSFRQALNTITVWQIIIQSFFFLHEDCKHLQQVLCLYIMVVSLVGLWDV